MSENVLEAAKLVTLWGKFCEGVKIVHQAQNFFDVIFLDKAPLSEIFIVQK